MTAAVSLKLEGGVARLRVDDGKVNALSADLMDEITAALDEAAQAQAVVVLSGRPGMFSAGFDLPTFAAGPEAVRRMLRTGAGLVLRLLEHPYPVVTVCEGHAYPMGAFLMLAADVRLATDGPWRIGLNEVAISITLPYFAVELARHRLTAPGLAAVTTATMFKAADALRVGYLDRVVAADEIDKQLAKTCARLTALDFGAHAATKARIHAPLCAAIREGIDREFPAEGTS